MGGLASGGAGFRDRIGMSWEYLHVTLGNPALGTDWTYTVPQGVYLEPVAIRHRLITSAAVATRYMRITILDDTGNLFTWFVSGHGQAASTVIDSTWVAGIGDSQIGFLSGTSSIDTMALPAKLILLPGWVVQSQILNLQAGDQIQGPILWFRQFSIVPKVSLP